MDSSNSPSTAKLIAAAASCAALYAIVNILTSPIRTPWGVGEFRPGVVIPAFYALVFGPVPAAFGAGFGSFIGDMVSLVPGGASSPLLAIFAGGIGNFLGFLLLGWVYEKIKGWRGFIAGTTSGLFVGNLWAAGGVVLLLHLPVILVLGFLLFWFGTMFPFVIFFVPALVRAMRPYSSQISSRNSYPELVEPNKKILWGWTIAVTILVLASTVVIVGFQSSLVQGFTTIGSSSNSVTWIEILLVISAVSALVVGAFIPGAKQSEKVPVVS
jgi:hypothetical protein